ncbi:MAG: type II toxin-antitoxin system VapC family toxin [Actinomycetota bacterium]|nr:type II toxin-antitoxin system VapC family toxin [Actinomycetota bacterium]
MKVVDANVLLYAVNESAEHHDEARDWLDGALSGRATVGFSWVSLLAFLRLSTKIGLFPTPLPVDGALDRVRAWLVQPTSVLLVPTPRHLEVLTGILGPLGAGGNLTSDAHLAALALEHRGDVVTYDSDFGRFPGVSWLTPARA